MARPAAERRLDHSRGPRQRSLEPAGKAVRAEPDIPENVIPLTGRPAAPAIYSDAPSQCMPVTWLCRVQTVSLKCQEPVEGQQLWVCLIRVPDRQRRRLIPTGQA